MAPRPKPIKQQNEPPLANPEHESLKQVIDTLGIERASEFLSGIAKLSEESKAFVAAYIKHKKQHS